jgi:ankyrin repeat protein
MAQDEKSLFPNYKQIVSFLIEHDVYDPEYECYDKDIFIKAASKGRLDVIEYLVCNGCGNEKIYVKALTAAITTNHDDIHFVLYLWSMLKEVYYKRRLIKHLVKMDNINLVIELLEFDQDKSDYLYTYLLRFACKKSQFGLIKYLLENFQYSEYHLTSAVKYAIKSKNIDTVKFLAKLKLLPMDVNSYTNDCTIYGNVETLRYFLDKGLQFTREPYLVDIIIYNDIDMFVFLVEDLQIPLNDSQNRLLFEAVDWNKIQIMHYLIDHKQQTFTKKAFHSLSVAVRLGHLEIFRHIMSTYPKQSVIVKAANSMDGETCHIEMIRVLAPFKTKSISDDRYLICDAICEKNLDFAEYLLDNYQIALPDFSVRICIKSLIKQKKYDLINKFWNKYNNFENADTFRDIFDDIVDNDDYEGAKFVAENYYRPTVEDNEFLIYCSSVRMLKYLLSFGLEIETLKEDEIALRKTPLGKYVRALIEN